MRDRRMCKYPSPLSDVMRDLVIKLHTITPNKRNLDRSMHRAMSFCADHTEGSCE